MFDPYYETKVNVRIQFLSRIWGFLLIFLGIGMITFTIVDLRLGMSRVNDSYAQENSIWPTIGKGLWVGALVILTGIIEIIVVYERTQVSVSIIQILITLLGY